MRYIVERNDPWHAVVDLHEPITQTRAQGGSWINLGATVAMFRDPLEADAWAKQKNQQHVRRKWLSSNRARVA